MVQSHQPAPHRVNMHKLSSWTNAHALCDDGQRHLNVHDKRVVFLDQCELCAYAMTTLMTPKAKTQKWNGRAEGSKSNKSDGRKILDLYYNCCVMH